MHCRPAVSVSSFIRSSFPRCAVFLGVGVLVSLHLLRSPSPSSRSRSHLSGLVARPVVLLHPQHLGDGGRWWRTTALALRPPCRSRSTVDDTLAGCLTSLVLLFSLHLRSCASFLRRVCSFVVPSRIPHSQRPPLVRSFVFIPPSPPRCPLHVRPSLSFAHLHPYSLSGRHNPLAIYHIVAAQRRTRFVRTCYSLRFAVLIPVLLLPSYVFRLSASA